MEDKKYGLKAPAIMLYLFRLGQIKYSGWGNHVSYDEATYPLLDELFELLRQIVPSSPGRAWELWLRAERGTLEDYSNLNNDSYGECDELPSREECEQLWKQEFPEETEWFYFCAVEDPETGYRTVAVNHRLVILQCPDEEKTDWPYNVSEFVGWLVDSVRNVIKELEDGSYNDRVRKELPVQHRTGTIRRKDFWNVYPEARKEFFKDLSEKDVEEFVSCMMEQNDSPDQLPFRISSITANEFYRYCALGYRENDYEGTELSPKEQYYKHADGRDEGLRDIDGDSPEAFADWYYDKNRGGGHPWEVCRGGNSTHVSLYVHGGEEGWYLAVAGDAWSRTVESVKFYLALHRKKLPVYMYNGKILANRLLEGDHIGVVPQGVFPAYYSNYFPGEKDIIDYINLSFEDKDKLAPFCLWKDIPPVELAGAKEPDEDIIEVEIETELLERFKKMIEPMGLTPEVMLQQFLVWLTDPKTSEEAIAWLKGGSE